MSSEINKLKMRTANNKPQRMPITTQVIGTTDFFKTSVVAFQEVVPGEHVKLQKIVSIQGKPMAMPAEVKLKHSLRAFWVPQRVISKDWLSFITGTPFVWDGKNAIHEEDQNINNNWLVNMFTYSKNGLMEPALDLKEEGGGIAGGGNVKGHWDIFIMNMTKSPEGKLPTVNEPFSPYGQGWWYLTNKGRHVLSILSQIGIEINWVIDNDNIDIYNNFRPAGMQDLETGKDNMSSKAIVALFKVMCDWYIPSQYENEYAEFLERVKDMTSLVNRGSNYAQAEEIMTKFLDVITFIAYEVDYFTGAWKQPTGPNDDKSKISISDITSKGQNAEGEIGKLNYSQVQYNNKNDNTTPKGPTIQRTDNNGIVMNLSKYILNALDAVQNYVTRNRIAGYRPVDRFLAQFGVHLNYIQTGRSQYLGGSTVNLNISQVVAQAETAGATAEAGGATDQQLLGGKGAILGGTNKLGVSWKADEHGYIIIIQTIIPQVGYYQGLKPWHKRLHPMDFYTASFDNLGIEAIPQSLLMHNYMNNHYQRPSTEITPNAEQIWGYGSTYSSYKVGFDVLSGDYRVRSLAEGIQSMHTMRIIDNNAAIAPKSVSLDFIRGDGAEYDRLFAYTGDDVDHIYFTSLTINTGTKPMKSTSEAMDITDGEGQWTEFETGGSYMN